MGHQRWFLTVSPLVCVPKDVEGLSTFICGVRGGHPSSAKPDFHHSNHGIHSTHSAFIVVIVHS